MASGVKLFVVRRRASLKWNLSNPSKDQPVSNKLFRTRAAARAYIKTMYARDKGSKYRWTIEPAMWGPDNV